MAPPTSSSTPQPDLRGAGRNLCQPLRECPASQYLVCGCLESQLNCWELTGKPCCKRDEFQRCADCEIYVGAVRLVEELAEE